MRRVVLTSLAIGFAGTLLALAWRAPASAPSNARSASGGRDGIREPASHDGLRYRHSLRGQSPEAAIAFLEERVARMPKQGLDLAELAAMQLEMARRTGDARWYEKAETSARRSLENLPYSNHGATLVLAKAAAARHDFAEAIRLADEVLAANPRVVDAVLVRASARLALGDLDAALEDADRAVAAAPLMGALALRGQIHEARGRDADALADWRAALRIEEPGQGALSAQVRAFVGRMHLRQGRLADARAWLQESRRISPAQPIAALALAEAASLEGDAQEAERVCNAAFNVTRDPVFLVTLGTVRDRAGDVAGASTAWAQAEALLRAELDAGRFGHRAELARVLLLRGGEARATEALVLTTAELETRRPAELVELHERARAASSHARARSATGGG